MTLAVLCVRFLLGRLGLRRFEEGITRCGGLSTGSGLTLLFPALLNVEGRDVMCADAGGLAAGSS